MIRTAALITLLLLGSHPAWAAVSCENVDGECTLRTDTASCSCEDGTMGDMAFSVCPEEGCEGDPPEPTMEDCLAFIDSFCPRSMPNLEEECTPEALEFCNGFADVMEECWGDFRNVAFQIANCCKNYLLEPEELEDMFTCLDRTSCGRWDGECYDVSGEGGEEQDSDSLFENIMDSIQSGDDDDDTEDSADEEEQEDLGADESNDGSLSVTADDSGCSATGSASILMLLGLASVLRRKR